MDQATKPNSRGASDVVIRRLAEGRTVRSVGVEEELLIVERGAVATRTGPQPPNEDGREAVTDRDLNVNTNRRSGRFGRGDVLRSRPLVTGGSVAASHRAQPLPICSAGGSRDPSEVVAAELVTLVPAARDQRLRNRPAAALT
jgi:hypothetical protein